MSFTLLFYFLYIQNFALVIFDTIYFRPAKTYSIALSTMYLW